MLKNLCVIILIKLNTLNVITLNQIRKLFEYTL